MGRADSVNDSNLITLTDPKSYTSEAYRMCRTNLHYLNIDKAHKSIVVSSAHEMEGKTTTACNLAIIMAQAGKNVLLIDCDMRKPKIHIMFDTDKDMGLTNIMAGDIDYKEVIKDVDDVMSLSIITSGPIPPNPSEILHSNAMKDLLVKVKDEFDLVLIDAPPVCVVTDATILGTLVDGVILVMASEQTTTDSGWTAIKALAKVNAKILGIILTKVRIKKNHYYNYSDKKKVIFKKEFRKKRYSVR